MGSAITRVEMLSRMKFRRFGGVLGLGAILLPLGCAPSAVEEPVSLVATVPNAGACNLSLLKEPDGYVRLDVRNVKGDDLLICMNFAYPNFIRVELKDAERGWIEVPPVDPQFEHDPKNPGDEDWLVLRSYQGHSGPLEYNETGRLKVGDRARVTWHCDALPPKVLKRKGTVFPNHEVVAELTVR